MAIKKMTCILDLVKILNLLNEEIEAAAGVYAYKVKYRTPCSKNQIEEKLGTIMLLR